MVGRGGCGGHDRQEETGEHQADKPYDHALPGPPRRAVSCPNRHVGHETRRSVPHPACEVLADSELDSGRTAYWSYRGQRFMMEVRGDDRAREEAELVARIARGDLDQPLAELVERYQRPLFGYGLKVLGDPWLAEELVHECFIRLWRTAGRFDPNRATVGAYLFMVARTMAIDVYRRSAAQNAPGGRRRVDVEPEQLAEQVPIDDDSARLVERMAMRDALNSLSPAHREVLLLAHYDGLTQAEIADRLGIPLGTVKTRMFHGLRALRSVLDRRDADD
jgi:RNA polymerase sigma-70 factor, ECF subfamily